MKSPPPHCWNLVVSQEHLDIEVIDWKVRDGTLFVGEDLNPKPSGKMNHFY